MILSWLEFCLCAAVIGYAGVKLSVYGDIIAVKTGLGGSWVGLVLMATVTSLPELATGISAVGIAGTPNIAVGDVLGSCVFNLALLVVLDFLHRKEPVYTRARQGHILSAGFGVILIAFAGLNILIGQTGPKIAIGHVGVYAPIIALFYWLAMRSLFRYEQDHLEQGGEEIAGEYGERSMKQAARGYALAALAVVLAGGWLPFLGAQLGAAMGWNNSFVGTLFVAIATSLPELVVVLAALRLRAIDMAIANLLGSNLFNIVVLAIDDVFYRPGPLLYMVSPVHGASALSAVLMSGLVIVGLLYRPRRRFFRLVGWISIGLLATYVMNSYFIYIHDD